MPDAWRLAVGTLTAVPVAAPRQVDRTTARNALLLAPLAVLPLGIIVAAVLILGRTADLPPLATGFLAVGGLALGSRGLHWDGLSDTVDGLTASYDRERALAVMKTGTSGPAGVLATVVVAGVQAAAFGALTDEVVIAGTLVCLSRCALWIACCTRVPAARPDGLGVGFTATVPVLVAAPAVLLLGVTGGLVVLALVAHAVRRLGGVTGDVMGAAVELALATMLVSAVAVL
ncbi:adenosylcobinamide-GDP ribazoletransferase [Nocardioides sp. MAH-18]|uniref:Adenosylcobinamide-GDP ribazoletransferase n=1 Tax=Nocardioides agri TaxID=2682843 RepID=A0A6L6XZ77_9ACTN|nr:MULTISPECIES: adenosylcobinamide-GDP ribazoletransferase [unclassified Nocardioides]MBA2952910.1 adenosylcobinamide-GDP ribazoletransferase [Nocardioides sp. CGMCC 1.13656]MVQ52072.1 adenosylcobinamide-GDP ribazoletransferase [Nocardioides sp. MAH-18]